MTALPPRGTWSSPSTVGGHGHPPLGGVPTMERLDAELQRLRRRVWRWTSVAIAFLVLAAAALRAEIDRTSADGVLWGGLGLILATCGAGAFVASGLHVRRVDRIARQFRSYPLVPSSAWICHRKPSALGYVLAFVLGFGLVGMLVVWLLGRYSLLVLGPPHAGVRRLLHEDARRARGPFLLPAAPDRPCAAWDPVAGIVPLYAPSFWHSARSR